LVKALCYKPEGCAFDLPVPEVSYGLNNKRNNGKLDKAMPNLGSTRKSNRTKNPISAKQDDFLWTV
jgi:hypothetical protein